MMVRNDGDWLRQGDVARRVGVTQSVVSQHFNKLSHARFMTKKKQGGWERGPNYEKYLRAWGVI